MISILWKCLASAGMVSVLLACSAEMSQQKMGSIPAQQGDSQPQGVWVQSPQKHNNSGISMRYLIEGELAVGRPVTIKFEFAGANAQDAQVSVNPAKTLTMNASAGLQKSGAAYQLALKPNQVSSQSITVTPTSEGEHFISMQLAQNGQATAAGVMLRVGQRSQPYDTPGERITTEQGEKLIVMPAK